MTLILTLLKVLLALVALAFALLIGAVLANRAPLFDAPGASERLHLYFTTHVAELSDQPRLPELQAHDDARDAAALYAQARLAVEKLGWELVTHDDAQHRVEAVVTTRLWKFKDDVSIWIVAQPNGGSRLYARAQSRVGRGDMGANARHLRELIEAITGL